MKNRTTIQIPIELRKELLKIKKFKKETYEEVIKRLLEKEMK
jgi:predicted CopG family antitoxin